MNEVDSGTGRAAHTPRPDDRASAPPAGSSASAAPPRGIRGSTARAWRVGALIGGAGAAVVALLDARLGLSPHGAARLAAWELASVAAFTLLWIVLQGASRRLRGGRGFKVVIPTTGSRIPDTADGLADFAFSVVWLGAGFVVAALLGRVLLG